MSVSINGTGGITFADASTQSTGGYTGFRNRIINGDMRIDQRNAGASVTVNTNPVYGVDRFYGGKNGTVSNFTMQRVTTAPAGFQNSLLITSGTGVTPAANDFMFLSQGIEGFNFADLGFGTTQAQSVTVSFWVRSSLTGNFGMGLRNGAANRSYIASFTINAANTWEYKAVTIPGDTTGTWATDNTQACGVFFDLGNGSNFSSTSGSWSSANLLGGLTGGVKLSATTGATLNITGVQLEKGSVATPFEFRQYGTELALCQRYCYRWDSSEYSYAQQAVGRAINTTLVQTIYQHPVTMRAAPTITYSGSFAVANGNAVTSITTGSLTKNNFTSNWTTTSVTANGAFAIEASNTNSAVIIVSSEL